MTSADVGSSVFYKGRVNGPVYIEIIDDVLPRFIHDTSGTKQGNWQYMQDNAPPHKYKFTMNYLKKHRIAVLVWPASSPRTL